MLFSDPYYDSGQLIVVNQDRQGIATPDDLKGKTVGVQINTTAQFDLEKREGVKVAKYNTIDLALLDLRNRRIDAVVIDAPVAKYMIFQSFHDLKTVGRRFTDEKFGIAIGQEQDDLASGSTRRSRHIKETGEYDRIHEKWFGEASERAADQAASQTKPKVFDISIVRRTLVAVSHRRLVDGPARAAEPGAGPADRLALRAGSRAVVEDSGGPGRLLCRSDARHAAAGADPFHLFRAALLIRSKYPGLLERHHRPDLKQRGVYL